MHRATLANRLRDGGGSVVATYTRLTVSLSLPQYRVWGQVVAQLLLNATLYCSQLPTCLAHAYTLTIDTPGI